MKKNGLIALLIFISFTSIGQKISHKMSKIYSYEMDDEILVYGMDDSEFRAYLYNSKLELTAKYSQVINKGSNNILLFDKMDNGYRFELNFCEIVIDNKLKKISYKEWERSDRKTARKASTPKKYLPNRYTDATYGKQPPLYYNGKYIEVSDGQIRLYSSDENSKVASYKIEQSISIGHKNDNFKFFIFNSEPYVYCEGDGKLTMVKIDIANKSLTYKTPIDLGEDFPYFSNCTIGPKGELVVVGNYSESKISNEKDGMKGWFICKINPEGKVVNLEKKEFNIIPPIDYKGKQFKDSDLSRVGMNIRSIEYDEIGVKFIGEYVRIYDVQSSQMGYNGSKYTKTMSSGSLWQSFGVELFEMNDELEITNKVYSPELNVSKDYKKGQSNTLVTTVYGHNMRTIIRGYDRPIGGPAINHFVQSSDLVDGKAKIIYSLIQDNMLVYYTKDLKGDFKNPTKIHFQKLGTAAKAGQKGATSAQVGLPSFKFYSGGLIKITLSKGSYLAEFVH